MVHRHKMVLASWGGKPLEVEFRCRCGETQRRPATPQEAKWLKQDNKEMYQRISKIHAISHSFQRKFLKDMKFVCEGYKLICLIEKWSRKHPTVRQCTVDCNSHAGATLFFIPHETEDEYWGTSVIYVPQFDPPAQFFLYPGHLDGLLEVLKGIKSQTFKKNGRKTEFSSRKTKICWDSKRSRRK